jgi:hypothetical protein
MRSTFAAFGLLLATGAGAEPVSTAPDHPLILEAHEDGGMVEVSLRTNASAPMVVSYSLTVGGASRTSHQGKTTIRPGASHTLSTVRINAKPGWGVRLKVEPEGGAAYEQTLGDPALL